MICKAKMDEECPSHNYCSSLIPLSETEYGFLPKNTFCIIEDEQYYVPECVAKKYLIWID